MISTALWLAGSILISFDSSFLQEERDKRVSIVINVSLMILNDDIFWVSLVGLFDQETKGMRFGGEHRINYDSIRLTKRIERA